MAEKLLNLTPSSDVALPSDISALESSVSANFLPVSEITKYLPLSGGESNAMTGNLWMYSNKINLNQYNAIWSPTHSEYIYFGEDGPFRITLKPSDHKDIIALTSDIAAVSGNYALKTTKVNGHAISGDVTIDATDISSGTFSDARIPNLAISKITNLQTTLDSKVSAVTMNSIKKTPSNGIVDLGTVLTAHQSLTGYVPITRTINGQQLTGNIVLDAASVSAATEEFVAESITQGTAFYRGSYASRQALISIDWQTTDPNADHYVSNNDYAVVLDDETHDDECWRYIYVLGSGWTSQYMINESPLTLVQQAALNSGATSAIINSIADKADSSELTNYLPIDGSYGMQGNLRMNDYTLLLGDAEYVGIESDVLQTISFTNGHHSVKLDTKKDGIIALTSDIAAISGDFALKTTTVNGQQLTGNIVLDASSVNAVPLSGDAEMQNDLSIANDLYIGGIALSALIAQNSSKTIIREWSDA